MKYRKLGKTGLEISEIGFGAWGIGGDSYGPTDDFESMQVLRLSYEKGITFFDTANAYGAGRSERIIGKALKEVRDKIVIASKVGIVSYNGRTMTQNFSARHIKESIEVSLRRLQTDYIDVYQLHSPPNDVLRNDEMIRAIEDLKKSGKVRAIGVSVRSPDAGILALSNGLFEIIQVNFNVIDQRLIDSGLLERAQARDIAIIARTPLCFGFLSGNIQCDIQFGPDDHRAYWSRDQIALWSDSIDKFKALYLAREWSPVCFALKFCLYFEGVSTVIPGMTRRGHVEENIMASELDDLSAEEIFHIRDIYSSSVFFIPPKN
jgi:aryl-alcohol dehydrogenase-like predicted oxidoreductase